MLGGRRALVAVTATVACMASAGVARAAPGDLDSSFGKSGIATLDLHHNAFGNALVVQPDGKVIVVGTAISTSGATTDVVAARFTTQGVPDSSYGQGSGAVQPDPGQNETAYGAALQPDGKLVVAGDSSDSSGKTLLLVARFNGDGSADTNFGSQGTGFARPFFQLNDSFQTFGRAVALQPNGQIVVVGYATGGGDIHPLVARINNPGGTPDTAFAADGEITAAAHEDQLLGVAVTSNTKIDAVGEHQDAVGSSGDFFAEGGSGEAISPQPPLDLGGYDAATAVAAQPDGKLLVAGYTNTNGTYDYVVARLNADDSLDTSFGTGGKTIIDLGGSDYAKAIALQSDGKIVVAGTTTSGSTSQIGVVRLMANGQLDSAFGHNGVSLVSSGAGQLEGNAVGLEPNGDIVVGGVIVPAGGTQRNLLVVRLHGDASSSTGASNSGGGAGGGGSNTGAPTPLALSNLAVSKSTFREAGFLPKLNPATRTKGTLISLSLSASAPLTLIFSQAAPGRISQGHCSAPSKNNRHGARCTRHLVRGSLSLQAVAGANKIAFGGRLTRHKKLAAGTYTLMITAGATGATSATTTVKITIRR
ncbi:MAG TPA: hypothetical protein VHX66_15170 [Solirubrobacteraceae bacterium]|jgi:uncharacterized delta-60 repeat protein|nr:hypothetical protein [Solirubrobacteraceae bacterium]